MQEKIQALLAESYGMMLRFHELKTWPKYFDAVKSGQKKVEIREGDRDFRVDDLLRLNRFDPNTGIIDDELWCHVTHILDAQPFVPVGYVAMSIALTDIRTLGFPLVGV